MRNYCRFVSKISVTPPMRYEIPDTPPLRYEIPLYRSHSHRTQVFQNTKIDEEEEDTISNTVDYGRIRVHETGVYENHHQRYAPSEFEKVAFYI